MCFEELKKLEHFQYHPELIPFIGQEFSKYKILFIGESHYLPKATKLNIGKFSDWYTSKTSDDFSKDDKSYFSTRNVVNNYISDDRSKAHTMFSRPAKVFCDLLSKKNINIDNSQVYKYFAFYNYYQRPEITFGHSFNVSEDLNDSEYAKNISNQIFDILKPSVTIFLSKKAYYDYGNRMNWKFNCKIEGVAHPTCSWWNRKTNDGKCGKCELERILSEEVELKSS
ncbi:MAG: hypothetical protein JXQ23_08805 [Clostridia bacterium]|nr:hypothetical protein [Clostridia bacterium]